MNFQELLQFIDLESKRLIQNYGQNSTEQEIILARTVKLTEELGELCNEVLAFNGDQREDKLNKMDKNNLPNELADVIITTLLLAKAMDVDIREALKNKIEKINNRC
ncbi:hypothetical protein HOC90_00895 [Candidatus Falkowbacteria bacterium]|nr:hypothetical protein [Candidatus Falkowbacteria bacterium]